MLLIGVFAVLTAVCFALAALFYKRCYSVDISAAFAAIATCFACAAVTCICLLIPHKIPSSVKNKRIDLETRYSSLTYALKQDDSKSALLAGDIAAYNSEVLRGRSNLHNIWLRDYQYPFWDEIPLIEYAEEQA